jgi:N-succinyldiaminopimelate aminotransferase
VQLRTPDWSFDPAEVRAAISPRTRLLLLNSPHNPTGMVLQPRELAEIARLCVEHDLVAVTDEVYEHLVFDGAHIPLASLPGMADRTVTISSAGKTFSVTGWKIGWVCAAPPLVTAVRTVKQFLTYVNGAPFQPAIAHGLAMADELVPPIVERLRAGRDQLAAGLTEAGFEVYRPHGTYFITTDIRPLGETDGIEFCRRLPHRAGVVAIRFAFCKRPEVLAEAARRLRRTLTG